MFINYFEVLDKVFGPNVVRSYIYMYMYTVDMYFTMGSWKLRCPVMGTGMVAGS